MNPLRLVSVTHPSLDAAVGTKRLQLVPNAEVTILAPHDRIGTRGMAGSMRRFSVPTSGSDTRGRFPSLGAALGLLDPDVVHLHADPDTSLALQVARFCGKQTGRGLVIESETDPAAAPSWTAALRARRTLSRTHAVVARSAGALAALRRLGFDGLGLIAGRGLEPQALPGRDAARSFLHIMPSAKPIIGWSGPLDTRSHVADLLEAVALCNREVVVVIPAIGSAYHDVLDRADALEILDRIRFVTPERSAVICGERPDLSAFPMLLAAVDALLVAPQASAPDRAGSLRTIELAHMQGIPVIHPGLPDMADMVADGGWRVPFGDPALLARLFDELQTRPLLLQSAAAAAATNALARHSPEAAASELARAVAAAAEMAGAARMDGGTPRSAIALGLRRQPGST